MEAEKQRADRFEEMLEDSRRDRDAECERLQKNIDSQKEQLDVGHCIASSGDVLQLCRCKNWVEEYVIVLAC